MRRRAFLAGSSATALLAASRAEAWLKHGANSTPSPPVISNVSSGTPGATTATVTWNTDTLSSSRVNYGLTTGYGSNVSDATLVTSHSLGLSGLTVNTTYQFDVASTDAHAQTSTSGNNTFSTTPIVAGWAALPIGGGGFARQLNQNTGDGTKFLQTDVSGGWVYNSGSGQWQQTVTGASMPASFFTETGAWLPGVGVGTYAIASAPTNSSIVYMAYIYTIYKSLDKGVTWAKTGFPGISGSQDIGYFSSNFVYDTAKPRMAVDPANASIVWLSGSNGTLFKTTDGGTTWSTPGAVPAIPPTVTLTPILQSGKTLIFNGAIGWTTTLKVNMAVGGTNVPVNARISSGAAGSNSDIAGTVAGVAGTKAITGTGTLFRTALVAGGWILIHSGVTSEIQQISTITNDTTLTTVSNLANTYAVANIEVLGTLTLTQTPTGTITSLGINYGPYTIVFDPASAVVGGATQGIYISVWGVGLYHSTDGGATFSAIAASGTVDTTTIGQAKMDPAGVYYCLSSTAFVWGSIVQNSQYLHKYTGSWTQLFADTVNKQLSTFCVDPGTPAHMAIFYSTNNTGRPNVSIDGGSTWSGLPTTMSRTGAIGWQTQVAIATALFPSQVVGDGEFDLTVANQIVLSTGNGSQILPFPVSGAWPAGLAGYVHNAQGEESLVCNKIIALPGSRGYFVRADDFPLFILDGTTYPSAFFGGPAAWNNGGFGVHVEDIDYASDLNGTLISQLGLRSKVSIDWGVSWNAMPNIPSSGGGSCAASTSNSWMYGAYSTGVWYTLDAGAHWTAVSGLPTFTGGAPSWANYNKFLLVADRVTALKYSLYFKGQGVLRTLDGGATWSVLSNGSIPVSSVEDGSYGLFAVPGQAGDLFGCWSPFGADIFLTVGGTSKTQRLRYWSDVAGAWASVGGIASPLMFAVGKVAPGHSYPALYAVGYDVTNGNNLGLYRCINFDPTLPANATWTLLGGVNAAFPPLNLVAKGYLTADPDNYGVVAYTTQGAGCAKGFFP